jgi:ABC-type sugar transport system substrate-binding protein
MREKTKKIVGFSQTENIGPWRVAETNSIKAEAAKRKETYDFLMTDAQGADVEAVRRHRGSDRTASRCHIPRATRV